MTLEICFVDEDGVERRASPQRDIAYFWPQIVSLAETGLRQECWEPWLAEFFKQNRVEEWQLLSCLTAYYKFMQLALDPEIAHPRTALARSEFFSFPRPVQVAVMAKIGQIATGAFWDGIRSSTIQGQMPPSLKMIGERALKIDKEISRPYRPNPLKTLWVRLTNKVKNFTSKGDAQ